jgi:DNA-binding SARP family transcriptional activator
VRGEKGRILRTYRGFNRRMQRELATAPGPETTALLRDLIGRDASDALSLLQTSSSLA